MGTAHIEAKESLIEIIKKRDDIKILQISSFEDDIYLIKVESDILPPGYNGHQNIFFENGVAKFKRDVDT